MKKSLNLILHTFDTKHSEIIKMHLNIYTNWDSWSWNIPGVGITEFPATVKTMRHCILQFSRLQLFKLFAPVQWQRWSKSIIHCGIHWWCRSISSFTIDQIIKSIIIPWWCFRRWHFSILGHIAILTHINITFRFIFRRERFFRLLQISSWSWSWCL